MNEWPSGAPPLVTTLEVEWPMALPSMSNERMHPMEKHRRVKAQRASTELALHCNGVGGRLKPLQSGERLVVTLTRVSPRRIRDEHDNLRTAFKHVVDAVAAFFGIDDSDPRIEWRYGQVSGPAAVRVRFEVGP